MKKSVNHYRVTDRGYTIARQIKEFDDAINVVEFLLSSRGFSKEQVPAEDKLYLSYWFKPNKFAIQVIAYPSKQIVDIDHPNEELVNEVLKRLKIFNGTGLKYNALDLINPRYKPNTFQPKDVRFAESVNWNKGRSIIFDKKSKDKQTVLDYITGNKIANLNPNHGTLHDCISIEDVIRRSLSHMPPVEVYKVFKGKSSLSNNSLNKLIYKCTH